MFVTYKTKLLKISKTFSINLNLLNNINFYFINIIIFRFRFDRKELNNFNLHALLKVCEQKNYVIVFKCQYIYIIFKIIDIKTNTF